VQPDWDQLGGVGQWQALVAAWIDGRPWQVEMVEAAIPRLCPEKATDAQRCERAALLGAGLVALAPLAAEAERRQMAVIRAWDVVARAARGMMEQVEAQEQALKPPPPVVKKPRPRRHRKGVDEPVIVQLSLSSESIADPPVLKLPLISAAAGRQWRAIAARATEQQVAQRQRYLVLFGEGGQWFRWWRNKPEVDGGQFARLHHVRWELALWTHAQAQSLKSEGRFEEAFAKYGEAALAYEALLAEDPSGPDAYKLAWTLAECWYWPGVQCTAPRDNRGEIIEFEGEFAPTPLDRLDAVKKSCVNMEKSIAYYNRVRDWKGPRTRDDKGAPLDYTEPAAYSAIDSSERVLGAKASYPKADPERIDAMSLPTIRPSSKQDDDDFKAVENEKHVKRVTRRNIDPLAVEWILAADGYVALSEKYPSPEDPGRPWKLELKAAELLYKNRYFDPWPEGATARTPAEFWSARLRFRRIFERFPGTVGATEAVKWLLTAFGLERDMANFQEFWIEVKAKGLLPKGWDAPIRGPCFGPVSNQANELYSDAIERESESLQVRDPAERAAGLAEARGLYSRSAQEYARMRNDMNRLAEKGMAVGAAFNAYYRAEAWDKAFATLDLAIQILREGLEHPEFKTPPAALPRQASRQQREDARDAQATFDRGHRELLDHLTRFLKLRADLHQKLAHIEATAKDYLAIYEIDPRGAQASSALTTAARLSAALGNLPQAIALNERLIRDFANDSKQAKRVQDAAANLATLHRQAKDPTAELAALTAFTTRYKADKSASGRVFRSLARTAELQTDLGQAAAATATRKRIVATFAARALPRDAAPEAMVAAQATLDLLQPQVQTFLATKPDPTQLPKLQADLASLVTATQAVDSYDAPLVHASAAALRSRLRRHVALQARATAPELAARLQAESVTDLTNLLKTQPASTELRQELHYYQPDLTPPAGPGLVADFDPPGTLPLAIELPAPASDSAVAAPFNQALTHYRAGQNERAIAAALRAVQLEPAHSRSKVLLSTLQLRSGDPTGALATVDAGLTARPTDVMLLAQKVLALAALGRTPEALQVAQAALRMDHSNPELQRVVGDAYRLAGRDGLAELAYDIARSTYLDDLPKSDESALPVKQYDDRKLRSYGTLQGVDAEALPRDAGLAHLTAATARLVLWKPLRPDLHATRDDLESALKLRQDAAELHADLGAVLLALGDRAALPTLHRALELRQGDARLLNNLALAQRISGQAQQARATLDQAHRADPQLAAPLYNLALLRLDALRDGSDLAEIRKLLTQFKQLRGPKPAGQADPADALLAEAEALLAWRLAFPPS
jgi:Flp pilus assembly protein TadD